MHSPAVPRGTAIARNGALQLEMDAGDPMGRKILLVEDDAETAAYLSNGLGQEGHSVEIARNGQEGLFRGSDGSFDLIILDRMLPVLDGIAVLKALRAARVETPVLVLSALASVGDRIDGLESGSDDYLVKPFSFAELLARVNALGRRAREERPTWLRIGPLEIDLIAHAAAWAGRDVELQPREFELLVYLARNAGQLVTKGMLLEHVWGFDFDPRTSVVETHLSRLRGKLERAGAGDLVQTVRGGGYVLRPPA
jgi:two-component system OmpR family response regulator